MRRYSTRDVLDFLKSKIENELNTIISEINVERTDEIPTIVNVAYNKTSNQFPECFIEISSSSFENNNINLSKDSAIETMIAIITIAIKSNDHRLSLWIESYLEALFRLLYGYKDNNIAWIIAKSTIRDSINTKESQTLKICGFEFEIKII